MSTAAFPSHFDQQPIIIVMGVSGSGKSTVGAALARQLQLPFIDADDFHPQSNIEKMSKAIALNDSDRWPWLTALAQAISQSSNIPGHCVVACSALKKSYRDFMHSAVGKPFIFILLDGERNILYSRMQSRSEHYMPPSLLDSQLAELERPGKEELALTFYVNTPLEKLVSDIATKLDILVTKS